VDRKTCLRFAAHFLLAVPYLVDQTVGPIRAIAVVRRTCMAKPRPGMD
jgi:uncharacterized membrane protein